jgi:PKD repeat protein
MVVPRWGVTFADTSTGDVTGRVWTFGDGQGKNGASQVDPTYQIADTCTVELFVTGPGGFDKKPRSNVTTVTAPSGQDSDSDTGGKAGPISDVTVQTRPLLPHVVQI